MGFWMLFFLGLALQVVGELLRPKQKQEGMKPSSLSEFQFPTADATRTIQWWWGTCQLKGPNTTWFGDLAKKKITKKVKTGIFSSTKITQGWKYSLGVQLVFGWGAMDELIDFVFGDKSIFGDAAKTGTQGGYGDAGAFASLTPGNSITVGGVQVTDHGDYYSFTMDSPELLGNDDPKEGVKGPVKIYKGTFTQPSNDYLQAQWGEIETSAFRPLIHAVLEHCYLGNSATPPAISLVARRTPNPLALTGGAHNIAGDANVANMCYEVMTNLIAGMKISPARIDIASFAACGQTLGTEGLGVSMVVETATTGKQLLAEMLRHVDGVIYPDPETGLYTMKLARADYDIEDLPIFDKTNVDPDSIEFSRISWEDTKNTTVIRYVDRNMNFKVEPVEYKDAANIYVRGGQIDSESIDFLGYSNKEEALATAARVNKTRSSPLCRAQFITNRVGWTLRPGSVLRFQFPDLGIVDVVMRVLSIDYGNLEDPKIQVTCIEDVFAVNAFAFDAPPGSSWTPPPATDPAALQASRLWEVPYQMLGDERRMVAALGVRDDATAVTGFEVWVDDAGGTNYVLRDRAEGTLAGGTLDVAFNRGDTALTVANLEDESLLEDGTPEEVAQGYYLLLVDDELMGWTTKTDNLDGTWTFGGLVPGAMDTVERDHLLGAQVYFLDTTIPSASGEAGYTEDLTITAKLPTTTPSGTLALGSTPQKTVTTVSRAQRPNPPGNFEINATRPEDLAAAAGTLTITFAHRNKLVPGVIAQTAGDQGPEPGVTYTLRAYNDDTDVLLVEQDLIGGSPIDFAWDTSLNLRLELFAVDADGEESLQHQEAVLAYTTGGSTVITFPDPDPTTVVDDAIVDGVVDRAPSQNVVFDALATKASVQQSQQGSLLFAIAGGTADAMTAALTPAPTLADGMQIHLRAVGANTVTAPTLNLNGLGALTIFKFGGAALAADDINGAGHEVIVRYVAAGPHWELVTPAASGGGGGTYTDADARAAVIAASIVNGDTTHAPSGDAVFDALAAVVAASYTDADARAAVIASSIVNGDTTHAPDGNSVFDALAGKQPLHSILTDFAGFSATWSMPLTNGLGGLTELVLTNGTFIGFKSGDLGGPAVHPMSSDAFNFVGAANYAAMRIALGVSATADVVHIAGTEVITGYKDFSSSSGQKVSGGILDLDRTGDAAAAHFRKTADSGQVVQDTWRRAGVTMWTIRMDSSGNLLWYFHDDAGTSLGTGMTADRLTRKFAFDVTPTVGTKATGSNDTDAASTGFVQTELSARGPVSNVKIYEKLADTARTATTVLANDPDLAAPLAAGKRYRIKIRVKYSVANGTMDFKYGLAYAGTYSYYDQHSAAQAPGGSKGYGTSTTMPATTSLTGTVAGVGVVEYDINLETTTADTLHFLWSQNTSDAGAATVLEGSYIKVEEVGVTISPVSGTVNPSSPVTGQRFFRTDLGLDIYYDGTRWLTVQEYTLSFTPAESIQPTSLSAGSTLRAPVPSDYDIYLTRLAMRAMVATTNSGVSYWTFALATVDLDNATLATLHTATTQSLLADDWLPLDVALNVVVAQATVKVLRIAPTKVGTPGVVRFSPHLLYRKIIT